MIRIPNPVLSFSSKDFTRARQAGVVEVETEPAPSSPTEPEVATELPPEPGPKNTTRVKISDEERTARQKASVRRYYEGNRDQIRERQRLRRRKIRDAKATAEVLPEAPTETPKSVVEDAAERRNARLKSSRAAARLARARGEDQDGSPAAALIVKVNDYWDSQNEKRRQYYRDHAEEERLKSMERMRAKDERKSYRREWYARSVGKTVDELKVYKPRAAHNRPPLQVNVMITVNGGGALRCRHR
jgi:hypothetical protein